MSNRYCLEHIKLAWGRIDCTKGDRNSFGDRSNLATIPFKRAIKQALSHARRLEGNAPIDSCSRGRPISLDRIRASARRVPGFHMKQDKSNRSRSVLETVIERFEHYLHLWLWSTKQDLIITYTIAAINQQPVFILLES